MEIDDRSTNLNQFEKLQDIFFSRFQSRMQVSKRCYVTAEMKEKIAFVIRWTGVWIDKID